MNKTPNIDKTQRIGSYSNVVAAVPVGRLHGRNVYRVPVQLEHANTRTLATTRGPWFTVLAHSATDAANWARDNLQLEPCTTIRAVGPKLGAVERYIGWESYVGRAILGAREPYRQRDLFEG